MRVISIRQPWAMLVALGAKRRETRSWYTAYRGPIAIHASAAMPVRSKAACSLPLVKDVLSRAGYESWRDMPRGAIIAVGRLTDVQEISGEHPAQPRARLRRLYARKVPVGPIRRPPPSRAYTG